MGKRIDCESEGLIKTSPQRVWEAIVHPDTVASSITYWDAKHPFMFPCEPRSENGKTILRYYSPATPGNHDTTGTSEITLAEVSLVNQHPNRFIDWDVDASWYQYRLSIQLEEHREGGLIRIRATGEFKRVPLIVRFIYWISPNKANFSKLYLKNVAKVCDAELQS